MLPERTPPELSPRALTPLTSSAELPLDASFVHGPGTVLTGKYRIKGVLGRGGFATVYEAEQLAFARDVALKVLHRTDGTPQVLLERFGREVRISALVRHPNVLEVYDAGVLEDGSPFLAMEKVVGPTLRQRLERERQLPIGLVLELAAQLLAALAAIGAQGVIHRDIKPENLMLARAPGGALQLKLLDFGIALVREERVASRLTARGALIGTPQYMAPEQLRSEITDSRVDLYAAGVVLYEALTGELPHDAPDLSALTLQVLEGKRRPLRALRPDCPRRLAKLVERALASDPARRFPGAASMRAELERCRRELCTFESGVRSAGARWQRFLPRSRAARICTLLSALIVAGAVQAGAAALFRRGLGGWERAEVGAPAPASATSASATLASATKAERAAASATQISDAPVGPSPAAPTFAEPSPAAEPQRASGAAATREKTTEAQRATRLRAPSPAQQERGRTLMRRGLALYLHGDLDGAYAAYREASALAPEDPAAFRALGLLAGQLGRAREARRALARYLELAPAASDGPMIRARIKSQPANSGSSELVRSESTRLPLAAKSVL